MLPSGTIHFDQLLSGLMVGKKNSRFIADDVVPPVFSAKLTGKIAKMGDDHYRVDFPNRQVGTPGALVNWSVSAQSYDIKEFRLEHPVDDSEVPQFDDPYDARRDAQAVLWNKLMLKKEVQIASLIMTSGNYAAGHTDAANKSWNVPGTGTPVDDVQGAIETIISKSGASEDQIYGACSFKVYKFLRTNNQIKNVFLNTVPGASAVGALTRAQIAACLGLADLYVGPAVQITTKEGAAATKAYVWGDDDFAVFYKTPGPSLFEPNFAYGVYPRIPSLPGAQVLSDVYRREDLTSDMIRSRLMLDQVVADNEMGFLFTSVDNV